jgi:hypothetical protein
MFILTTFEELEYLCYNAGMFENLPRFAPTDIFILLWLLIWKGLALWRSGRLAQRYWFIAILLINTFGLLEIVYLFRFAKKPLTLDEIKNWKELFSRPSRSR